MKTPKTMTSRGQRSSHEYQYHSSAREIKPARTMSRPTRIPQLRPSSPFSRPSSFSNFSPLSYFSDFSCFSAFSYFSDLSSFSAFSSLSQVMNSRGTPSFRGAPHFVQ